MIEGGNDNDGRGNFFAVDRRAWAAASRTNINSMVAYLVIARGTYHDQRTSPWSVTAIEKFTALSRSHAHKAIETLIAAGLVRRLVAREKRGTCPRYTLVPAQEVPGCEGLPSTVAPDNPTAPDWTWLPNSLVDGANGEKSPVELVRQTQSLETLRLLVDLYHGDADNLADYGGIHWRVIRKDYERQQLGQCGEFVVYGFTPKTLQAWENAPFLAPFLTGKLERNPQTEEKCDPGWKNFWPAWGRLLRLGLVQMVPHLIEADNDTAEMIHPVWWDSNIPAEKELALAADEAARALLTEWQLAQAEDNGLILAPVLAHLTEVKMVGIARLRYRPHTKATTAWASRWAEWAEATGKYREIVQRHEGRAAA